MKFRYTWQDINKLYNFLLEQGTFVFPTLENGLFPAALGTPASEYTGYSSVWVRDNIYLAYAHYTLGQVDVALNNVNSLMTYFKKYSWRFTNIIEAKVDPQNVMARPHIRFEGCSLTEIEQKWSHAQNDALGYFLWFYCKLASEGLLKIQPEDLETLALFPFYFQAISYWQDEDNGHWEEVRKIEASSIGVVVAGLKALKELLIEPSLAPDCQYKSQSVSLHFLDELITQGTAALNSILPAECTQPEPKQRRYDAALLFLIYPLQVVADEMADQILQDVLNNLQGNYGIKRYLGDSFWAADYKKKLVPEARTIDFSNNMSFRDALLKEGEEAQWCIFDPIISVIFGLKFQKHQQTEILEEQTKYLNRSLGQLTAKDCEFGEDKCPELYCLENGKYVPNEATPLLWTQANLSIALKIMEQNLRQFS
ncbi:glycoside hydrolase family 15 protein [Lyngbya aestuarii]|uniref:glycoside hydrolase family 15 protein n=1 Tax=Lyngbya aestuarii TaxID=118322 RepID=UPI00403E2760